MPDKNEAEIHLQDLMNYSVVEMDKQDTNLVRIRVPLFTFWLQEGGANELRQDEITRLSQKAVISQQEELSAAEVMAVAKDLSYQGISISADHVRVWATQFGSLEDQRLMLKLLSRLSAQGLYTEGRITYALKQIHEMVLQQARDVNIPLYVAAGTRRQLLNLYVTYTDSVGESGSALISQYRYINRLLERLCGTPRRVFATISKELQVSPQAKCIVVCINDFIGSGQSATDQLNNLIPKLRQAVPNWQEHIQLIYATVVGFEKGIKFIETHTPGNIKVLSHKILTEADKAFSPDNTIFTNASERKRAYELAYEIGSALQKGNPLGWENSQALIVFPDHVPNNTLPIFFADGVIYNGKPWKALFPRS